MAFCDLCEMENCHHLSPGTLEAYEASIGGFLDDEEAGTGPEIDARMDGRCANCGKPFPAGTRIKHVLHLDHGIQDGGWVATCCFKPLLETS